jgi:hypothetical protein
MVSLENGLRPEKEFVDLIDKVEKEDGGKILTGREYLAVARVF